MKRREQTSSSLTILHITLLDSESHNPFLWDLSFTQRWTVQPERNNQRGAFKGERCRFVGKEKPDGKRSNRRILWCRKMVANLSSTYIHDKFYWRVKLCRTCSSKSVRMICSFQKVSSKRTLEIFRLLSQLHLKTSQVYRTRRFGLKLLLLVGDKNRIDVNSYATVAMVIAYMIILVPARKLW